MKHTFRLHPEPFEMIKSGKKKFEVRLFDEKRQKMMNGDELEFVARKDGELLNKHILSLQIFDSFKSAFDTLNYLDLGFEKEVTTEYLINMMREFYSQDKENKYGVLVIGIGN